MTEQQLGVLRDLWNGDIPLSPQQRLWIRQALNAQERTDDDPEAALRAARDGSGIVTEGL